MHTKLRRLARLAVAAAALAAIVPAQSLAAPAITTVTPAKGVLDQKVTITGSGLAGATEVSFGGVDASFTARSDTTITTTVPWGALTGSLVVATSDGSVTAPAPFAVQPRITTVTTGRPIWISGSALGDATAVYFGKVRAPFRVDRWDTIETLPPFGVTSARIRVVTPGGSARSADAVTVPVAPSMYLSADAGPPTTRLTVNIAGFTPAEVIDLSFDGEVVAQVTASSQGAVRGGSLRIPASALPGTHTIGASGRSSGSTASQPFEVRTDWSDVLGSPAHAGENPFENILHPVVVPQLTQRWQQQGASRATAPVVADGHVFTAHDHELVAYDAATGARSFAIPIDVSAPPAVADDTLSVVDADGHLQDYNARWSQMSYWDIDAGVDPSLSPVVGDDTVYAAADGPAIEAYDRVSAARRFEAPLPGGARATATPSLANGVLYIPLSDGSLTAMDGQTGAIRWTIATGQVVHSPVAVAGGTIYLGGADGTLYAYSAQTGAPLWSFRTGADSIPGTPAVSGGAVYVQASDGWLWSVTAAKGKLNWAALMGADGAGSPSIADGVVYVTTDANGLIALRATDGAELWRSTVDGGGNPPAISDGRLFVASTSGLVTSFGIP